MDTVLEASQLAKRFKTIEAVRGVSFSVRRGELFGFLGPNGAGKTTTIKMLTTLLAPTSGSARVAGFDVVHDQVRVREAIGVVFQEPSLDLVLTAEENLMFHGWLYGMKTDEIKARSKELLKLVDLEGRAKEKVANFSGGMKRRLEIARGLLHEPKLFFLDEPTLGLDPQTRNHIWGYLHDLKNKKGVTLFLTTHYMDEAEFCDRIAIMDNGKIVSIGTPAELKEATGKKTLNDVFLHLTGKEIRD